MNTLFTQPSSCSNRSNLAANNHPNSRFSPQKVFAAATNSQIYELKQPEAATNMTELANE